jgi:transient receptor potential cation channel subfamily M protein 3
VQAEQAVKLPPAQRVLAFYTAPITTFWAYSLSYGVFLTVFSYIVLIRTPAKPSKTEYFVILYVANVALEMVRRVGLIGYT